MKIEIRQLSLENDYAEYDMLQDIGAEREYMTKGRVSLNLQGISALIFLWK